MHGRTRLLERRTRRKRRARDGGMIDFGNSRRRRLGRFGTAVGLRGRELLEEQLGAFVEKGFQNGIMPTTYGKDIKPADIDALVKYLSSVTHK